MPPFAWRSRRREEPSRSAAVAAAFALAAVVFHAAPARAITHGSNDDGDPAVAALVDAAGNTVCSGTLVAPGAILTAAHCLDEGAPNGVYFGSTPPALGDIVRVLSVEQHPNYDPDTHAHDIGIVRLERSPSIAPAPIYDMPLDAGFVGQPIRIVGFGRTATLDDEPARKRTGESRVDGASSGGFTFRPAPSQTCFGDSGGPAFALVGGIEQLVGVTSTGDLQCDSGATDAVVGSFDTGFVAGYLAGAASSPGVAGGCALAGTRDRAAGSGGLALVFVTVVALLVRRLPRCP